MRFVMCRNFFLLLVICYSCTSKSKNEVAVKTYTSLSDTVSYTGIQSCRQCHSDKYETYIHTGMGMSFDLALQAKSSARFGSHEIIYDKFKNFFYEPFWQNDSLYIREFRLKGKDTVYTRIEKISYIVGSGQHTNSHMIDMNGYIYQAPATFYTQKQQWDLPPGFEAGYNSRFSRKIGLECMSCHNSFPEIVKGSENKYTAIPSGINCERCHGPGGEHVRSMQAGKTVNTLEQIDYSIVNPGKLSIDLQLDICQRCHIQGNAVLQEGKSFFDYRPGMKLSDVMHIFMPAYSGDEEAHIMASHAERMKMSPCFIESKAITERNRQNGDTLRPYKNAMTCVTCHNPHISVKETATIDFNNRCRSCHRFEGEKTKNLNPLVNTHSCTLPLIERQKVNDNCVQCHMQHSGSIDIPHVSNTDHWIRIPVTSSEKKKISEFIGLVCINDAEGGKAQLGNAWLSYFEKFASSVQYLDSAKKYIPSDTRTDIIKNFHQLVRWAFLKNDFEKVVEIVNAHPAPNDSLQKVSYSNEDAWTAYRIGESFYNYGDVQQAILYFLKAVKLAPYYPDFRYKLASAQQDAGQMEDARQNYKLLLKENPDYTSAWVNYGYLLLSTDHNIAEADRCYDKALSLDPDNIQAMFNKAGTLIYQQKFADAKRMLHELVRLQPENEKAKALLRQLK
jgi:Tfp pilus assembly protein PilF